MNEVCIIMRYNLGGEGEVFGVYLHEKDCLQKIKELLELNKSCDYGDDMQYDLQKFKVVK